MAKKTNGGKNNTLYEDYIKDILYENKNIYKYEVPLIIKAFKQTVQYFLDNVIEFKINDVFEFVKFKKKPMNMYVRYKDEYQIIPEHEEIKFKVLTPLKDYLNSRNQFKDVRHRENLPNGLTRNKKIF